MLRKAINSGKLTINLGRVKGHFQQLHLILQ